MTLEAVVFDMDGVLVDSETYWMKSRQDFAYALGKVWTEDDQRHVMGRSTHEWGYAMKSRLDIAMPVDEIVADIKQRVIAQYQQRLPVLPGAVEAVRMAAARYRVALASGSPKEIIQRVLHLTQLDSYFQVVISGDEIRRGKPAPDIYMESLRRLDVHPQHALGIEDSANGLRALKATGMVSVAVLNPTFPLSDDALTAADHTLNSLVEFSPAFLYKIMPVTP